MFRTVLLVCVAASFASAKEDYTAADLCGNVASIVNVIKEFTDLSIDVDFSRGNRILHGPASIQLTNDITTICEGLKLDENTILFLGNIKDNITITLRESNVPILIHDCNILAHISVERDRASEYTVTIKPHLIEVTDFHSVLINDTELDKRIADELVKPDVTVALTASDLGKTRIISPSSGQVNPFLPKQLVNEIYQYYFYRLTL